MKPSVVTQNIFPELNFDDTTIIKAYEGLFENPSRLYYELKKAFILASLGISFELIDCFRYMPGN